MNRKHLLVLSGTIVVILALLSLPIIGCSSQPTPTPSPTPKPTAAPAPTTAAPKPAPQTFHIRFGSSQVGSGLYAGSIAIGQAVKKHFPNIQVTVQEAPGGAFENEVGVGKGTIDLGAGTSASTVMARTGTGMNEKTGALPDIRTVWYYSQNPYIFMATKASGVKDIYGLKGKDWGERPNTNFTGFQSGRIMELAGVKANLLTGGTNNLIQFVKDRKTIGFAQGTVHPSGIWVELNATIPMYFFGVPLEVQKKFQEKYPGELYQYNFPANVYEGQNYPINDAMAWAADMVSNKNVPPWAVYDLLEAVSRERQAIVTAMKGATDTLELEKVTVSVIKSPQLMHAGAVQWYKDKGVTVPAGVIPPEYTAMPDLKNTIK